MNASVSDGGFGIARYLTEGREGQNGIWRRVYLAKVGSSIAGFALVGSAAAWLGVSRFPHVHVNRVLPVFPRNVHAIVHIMTLSGWLY